MAATDNSRKLTPKQKRFCQEYIIDFNATKAAIRAGYSEKTAYSIGHSLLKKVEIQEEIEKQIELRTERTFVNADRVVQEAAKIAFSSIADLIDWQKMKPIYEEDENGKDKVVGYEGGISFKEAENMPESLKAAISEISEGPFGTLKIKMHAKMPAIELLAKHTGVLPSVQKHEITGKDGKPIEHKHEHDIDLSGLSEAALKELGEALGFDNDEGQDEQREA